MSTETQRFRKKPVEVEACQVTYDNRFEVAVWCEGEAQHAAPSGTVYAPGLVKIATLEGDMWANEGDWIICGVQGEFYPCKPDIFEATYELWDDLDQFIEQESSNDPKFRAAFARAQMIGEAHVEHYRHCGCLGDSAVCCVESCPCRATSDSSASDAIPDSTPDLIGPAESR